ncbi:MAG: zinc ribbon domain-containing protein [Ruminococcaceae bacterium]|nr:zinc ribbon domain-containing protein [Oscillospiraceae bacterium]
MAFFDKLKDMAEVVAEKAKDAAEVVSEKAKDVGESAKASMEIMSEQRELEKNYRAIGEWFVSEYEGEIPDAVKDVVAAVNASKAKIAELEAQKAERAAEKEAAAEEAAAVEAPAEEAPVAVEEPVVEEPAQELPVCPVCGKQSEGKFCPECGAPMNE